MFSGLWLVLSCARYQKKSSTTQVHAHIQTPKRRRSDKIKVYEERKFFLLNNQLKIWAKKEPNMKISYFYYFSFSISFSTFCFSLRVFSCSKFFPVFWQSFSYFNTSTSFFMTFFLSFFIGLFTLWIFCFTEFFCNYAINLKPAEFILNYPQTFQCNYHEYKLILSSSFRITNQMTDYQTPPNQTNSLDRLNEYFAFAFAVKN